MRKWINTPGFKVALIAFPIFIGALDLTVVSAVLPQVLLDLEIPFQTVLDDAAWIVYRILAGLQRIDDLHGAAV